MRFACLTLLALGCASSAPTINRAGGGTEPQRVKTHTADAAELAAMNARLAEDAAARERCKALAAREVAYDEEVDVGLQTAAAVLQALPNRGLYVDAPGAPETQRTEVTRYVNVLGRALADGSARPGIAWTFVVVDSDEVKAFSTAGGYVWVTTGLLKSVQNEAQLAGVLAHEIGHLQLRHPVKQYLEHAVGVCSSGLALAPVNALFDQSAASAGVDAQTRQAMGQARVETFAGLFGALSAVGLDQEAEAAAVGLLVFAGYDASAYAAWLDARPKSNLVQPGDHESPDRRAGYVREALRREYGSFDLKALATPALPDCVLTLGK